MTSRQRKSAIMSVFLPRENIFFIEEWLKYHITIGFDHFYLYNNMGSRFVDQGNNLEVTQKNKRGESIYKLLAHKSDAEVQRDLDNILEPFVKKGYVTQITWQPRDKDGNITFRQEYAFMDFIKEYSKNFDWVCLTDMDEFIVPVRHDSIWDAIDVLEKNKFTYITLTQKCFAPRFEADGTPIKKVLGVSQCSSFFDPEFAVKAMIKSSSLRIPWFNKDKYNLHWPPARKFVTKWVRDPDLLRFNHYKFNDWEVEWAAKNVSEDFKLDAIDDSLYVRFGEKVQNLSI